MSRIDSITLRSNRNALARNYWSTRLKGLELCSYFSTGDREYANSAMTGEDFAEFSSSMTGPVSDNLDKIARSGKAKHLVLLTALGILARKYSGRESVCLFTPLYEENVGESTAGDVIPVKMDDLSGLSFRQALIAVKEAWSKDVQHGDLPAEMILKTCNKTMGEPGMTAMCLSGIQAPTAFDRFAPDILFRFSAGVSVGLCIRYKKAVFDEPAIRRLYHLYFNLLDRLLLCPNEPVDRIGLMGEEEKARVLGRFNHLAEDDSSDGTLAVLFGEQAARTPERTALVFGGKTLTYREVDQRSSQLAHYLRRNGVEVGMLVPICMDRVSENVIAIIAVLKAGAAYVPINPQFPPGGIGKMIADVGCSIVLTDRMCLASLSMVEEVTILVYEDHLQKIILEPTGPTGVVPDAGRPVYVMFTSGSTGMPKGVVITDRNVVSLIKRGKFVTLSGNDVLLCTAAPFFDVSTWEYWSMLLTGGKLILCPERVLLEVREVAALIDMHGVNIMWLTSSLLNQWVNMDITVFAKLKVVVAGGEKLSERHIGVLRKAYPGLEIINGYGPTENTTFSLTYCLPAGAILSGQDPAGTHRVEKSIPIGIPLGNRSAYILDREGNLCPVGAVGELCVGGAGVAKGYLNRPELTAEKFIHHPFATDPNERLYRTGDLARWDADGNVEFLGRIDDQVKIRGFRIEPGEVEHVLNDYPAIVESRVLIRGSGDDRHLAAYYISGADIGAGELKAFLAGHLPEYMLPSVYVQVEHFPLTSNGKLDKKALLSLEPYRSAGRNAHIAPGDDIQKKLAGIWAEILRVDEDMIGVTDSFFELGGNSLKAMNLANRIQGEFNADISINDLFEQKTILGISRLLSVARKSGYVPIKRSAPRECYELSLAQLRLYYLHEFNKDTVTFNIPMAARLTGPLDKGRLSVAINKLIARHAALRTSIKMIKDKPMQFVADRVTLEIEQYYIAEGDEDRVFQLFIRPFDLEQSPLMRVGLLESGPESFILIVDIHHIIADGASVGLLMEDFMRLFDGTELPPPEVDYTDYAIWLQHDAYRHKLESQKKFWLRKFAEPPIPLDIPFDFERPDIKNGDAVEFWLGPEQTSRLRALAVEETATLSMILLSALAILLHKLSGQEDIVIGMAVGGRGQVELDRMIGMFAMVLPLRTHPRPDLRYREFLNLLRSGFFETFENQDYPYEELAQELNLERSSGRNPWFDVSFLHQNFGFPSLAIRDLVVSRCKELNITAHEEINLTVRETSEDIQLKLVYSVALFSRATAERFAVFFRKILAATIDDPGVRIGEIELTDEEERRRLCCPAPRKDIPGNRVFFARFAEQVRRTPFRKAAEHNGVSLCYEELYSEANRLASLLRSRGVGKGVHVVFYLPRGIEMLTALLAIMQLRATYIPIDTGNPMERVREILTDSEADLIITNGQWSTGLPVMGTAGAPSPEVLRIDAMAPGAALSDGPGLAATVALRADAPEPGVSEADEQDIAYIIYTSGTSGRPKGVMIHQSGMVNHLYAKIGDLALGENDVVAQTASCGFDISIWQFLAPLLAGGATYIIDQDKVLDAGMMAEELLRGAVTVLEATPSLIESYLLEPGPLLSQGIRRLKWMLSTGEPLPVRLAAKWFVEYPDIRFMNAYGPTEASDDITHYIVEPPGEGQLTIPIGAPIRNMQIYIVDKQMNLCPIGVRGEICVAGDGVGKGYWKDEPRTAASFLSNPFSTGGPSSGYSVLYRTGDLGYYREDGNIICLGRMDQQVKMRGFRIELQEIESRLGEYSGIRQCVVAVREMGGEKVLVAYYIAQEVITPGELRGFLTRTLPDHMIPSYFMQVEKLPLTVSGKLDVRSLPSPEGVRQNEYLAPTSETENRLVQIWATVLGIPGENIGLGDNLFELGGNSLKALRLKSLINKNLGWTITIPDIFRHPTISSLLEFVTGGEDKKMRFNDSEVLGEVAGFNAFIEGYASGPE